jgi:hypothetical protein
MSKSLKAEKARSNRMYRLFRRLCLCEACRRCLASRKKFIELTTDQINRGIHEFSSIEEALARYRVELGIARSMRESITVATEVPSNDDDSIRSPVAQLRFKNERVRILRKMAIMRQRVERQEDQLEACQKRVDELNKLLNPLSKRQVQARRRKTSRRVYVALSHPSVASKGY